ncbi:hypothetical protein TREES_T100014758 [Tupaia chinensis]|uniref:Uncharacterized protein n=1 Tax=Tupaia chinensis TaxID=246437 RepID=L9KV03_TUPCH|nr:hypothetical protein TREES_T100014758 [Tupaia chinensis]
MPWGVPAGGSGMRFLASDGTQARAAPNRCAWDKRAPCQEQGPTLGPLSVRQPWKDPARWPSVPSDQSSGLHPRAAQQCTSTDPTLALPAPAQPESAFYTASQKVGEALPFRSEQFTHPCELVTLTAPDPRSLQKEH